MPGNFERVSLTPLLSVGAESRVPVSSVRGRVYRLVNFAVRWASAYGLLLLLSFFESLCPRIDGQEGACSQGGHEE
jgi:hypothetical protein